jgi:hypothetical protein
MKKDLEGDKTVPNAADIEGISSNVDNRTLHKLYLW